MIYDDLTARMGVAPAPPPDATYAMPATGPWSAESIPEPTPCTCDVAARLDSLESLVRRLLPPEAVQDDLTADDHLVWHTGNALRPEDAALVQPPQHPGWRPHAHG